MGLKGYGPKKKDNKFTIENTQSGAGVTVSVNQPLIKMEFWTNARLFAPRLQYRYSRNPVRSRNGLLIIPTEA